MAKTRGSSKGYSINVFKGNPNVAVRHDNGPNPGSGSPSTLSKNQRTHAPIPRKGK